MFVQIHRLKSFMKTLKRGEVNANDSVTSEHLGESIEAFVESYYIVPPTFGTLPFAGRRFEKQLENLNGRRGFGRQAIT